LRDEGNTDPERKRQLFCYYLHDLLLQISNRWLEETSHLTNYVRLLDQIRHANKAGERICLVTFNYDLLIDEALLSFDYKTRDFGDEHNAHQHFTLFKPHGSADWGRFIDSPQGLMRPANIIREADTVQLSYDYVRLDRNDSEPFARLYSGRSLLPAIAIPVQTKTEDTFEWPPSQLDAFKKCLPSVTKILIIGWQAKEAHFLKLLREKLPTGGVTQITHLQVVGRDPAESARIVTQFKADIDRNVKAFDEGPTPGGFGQFVQQGLV
jgi:SIR2-like domain